MGERVQLLKANWARRFHDHWLVIVLGILGGAAAFLLLLARIDRLDWFQEERVGSAGEWFSGIAAATALLFLASEQAQARRDRAEGEKRVADAKREAEDERRAAARRLQAEQVTAWPIEWPEFTSESGTYYRVVVRIRNPTQSAIYHVSAGVGLTRNNTYLHTEEHQVLGPSEEVDLALDGIGLHPGEAPLLPPLVLLAFTDAAGQRWWRSPDELTLLGDHMRPDQIRQGY